MPLGGVAFGADIVINLDWIEEIRQWPHIRSDPELAAGFVKLFQIAFDAVPYPQQAYFGVLSSRISLTVGNIWLAAVTITDKEIYVLVDEALQIQGLSFSPVKSTLRYTPLFWMVAQPWEAITTIIETSPIWKNSFTRACVKVTDSPVSRIIIPKNQIHKKRLSDFFFRGDGQHDVPGVGPTVPTHNAQDNYAGFQEGGIQEVTIELQRRNPQLRAQAIAKYGYHCQVCGFDFEEFYGDIGAGYIEVHHLCPLSEQKTEHIATIEDVAVVCANCHRVLHRNGREPISLDELRKAIKQRTAKHEGIVT